MATSLSAFAVNQDNDLYLLMYPITRVLAVLQLSLHTVTAAKSSSGNNLTVIGNQTAGKVAS